MDDEVLSHMRDRVARVRYIASLAHDPEMIRMLLALAEDGEADIRKIEAERLAAMDVKIEPPPQS